MTLETFIQHFGYAAVFVGTFLEGEIILVLAGMAAHHGYMNLALVIGAAFLGTTFGDLLYFFLGRWHGDDFLKKKASWQRRAARVHDLLERYQTLLILSFRFLYGLRTVTPFVLGMSRVAAWKFVLVSILGALMWAVAVGYAGYLFGNAAALVLGDVKHYEIIVFAALAAVGVLLWALNVYRRRK
jgi:membrane protein DedA with SNARE-associated domain